MKNTSRSQSSNKIYTNPEEGKMDFNSLVLPQDFTNQQSAEKLLTRRPKLKKDISLCPTFPTRSLNKRWTSATCPPSKFVNS